MEVRVDENDTLFTLEMTQTYPKHGEQGSGPTLFKLPLSLVFLFTDDTVSSSRPSPPPLGYLSAGIAFCLLTHLSAFVRSKKLNIDSLSIEQRTRFATTLVTEAEDEGDFRGRCLGVETHIIVEGDQTPEEVQQLAMESENACMAMQAIMNATPTNTTIHLDGEEV